MIASLRRRRLTDLSQVTFCDFCVQVCTADCRTAAQYSRLRTAVLTHSVVP